ASGLCQRGETRSVEVHAVVVTWRRILAFIRAARAEPDLARRAVHAIDASHHPVALGDLVLHRAGRAVVEIQVIPAVPLRHPDVFAAVVDVVAVPLGRAAEERLRLVAHERARGAAVRVDLDYAEHLMSALVV